MRMTRSLVIALAVTALLVGLAPIASAHRGKCEASPGVSHRQENVVGTPGDDFINCAGLIGDHVIDGRGGNDIIWGGAGNDQILGGDGADQVRGGPGNDRIAGGNGDDALLGEEGQDTIDGGAGSDLITGDAGNDILTTGGGGQTDRASGGDGNDTLTGGSGNDELDGGNGDDVLSGAAGDDFFTPGAGNDTVAGGSQTIRDVVNALFATGPVVASMAGATQDGFGSTDTYGGIEALHGGAFDDRLTGDNGDNELIGSSGNDIVVGGAGNDLVTGGSGNDTLNGQSGDDIMNGGPGNDGMAGELGRDTFAGGDDSDTVLALTASVRFVSDMGGAYEDGYGLSGLYAETYTGVENLSGGSSADILTGDAGPNTLVGGRDDDTLSGLGGDDILVGNEGDDDLDGGVGTDSCFGDAGNDTYTSCENAVDLDGVPRGDLAVQEIFLFPDVSPGVLIYGVEVENLGPETVDIAATFVRGWFSVDNVLDGSDIPAGGKVVAEVGQAVLGAGASTTVSLGAPTPDATIKYLIVEVDADQTLLEWNESNNLFVVALQPDLIVQSIVLGAPAGSPQANTANPWTAVVKNVGPLAADIYLVGIRGAYSGNTILDDSDDTPACGTILSQIVGATLASGASLQVAVGCGQTPVGSYLFVEVDGTGLVIEVDEANNVRTLALP